MNFNYKWQFKNYPKEKNGYKVFSCFACGGGSTMGYKLAGYEVLGMNEIDPRMAKIYIENHKPKYSFIEDIRIFKTRKDLPKELYSLDILDGSPPCSSFSMCGEREAGWGKEKKFREGQIKQTLDNLFFDFIDLAAELKPKIVIAENVKGLLIGEAINYVNKIYKAFDAAGYNVKHFLLDASKMGVPQRRERVFFIAMRKDITIKGSETTDLFNEMPNLKLEFNEKPILYEDVFVDETEKIISERLLKIWEKRAECDCNFEDTQIRADNYYYHDFNCKYLKMKDIPFTITAGGMNVNYDKPRFINKKELLSIGTFPTDYNFLTEKGGYVLGMSVPPVMTAQIVKQIQIQWLDKMEDK